MAQDVPNDVDMFPWWPGEEHVYHSNTRLPDGRAGVLIDTGAWANLSGDRWANAAAELSQRAGKQASRQQLAKPISVQGVGNGSQQCTWQTTIPAAIRLADGSYTRMQYSSPSVPNSDLPALLGLRTLINHGAIIDCRNRKLYLCGPGDATIEPPPGTLVMDLEQAPSGHLILPISEYGRCVAWESRRQPGEPSHPEMALTSSLSTSSSSTASSAPSAARGGVQIHPSVGTGRSEGTRCPPSPAGRESSADHAAPSAHALADANVPSGRAVPAPAGQ